MPFKIVHQVACDVPFASAGNGIDKDAMEAHIAEVYDYLYDYFWPSLGYQVGELITDVLNVFAINVRMRPVDFPVTNAAGYADHTMHTIAGFQRYNGVGNATFQLEQYRNISTTENYAVYASAWVYTQISNNTASIAKEYYTWLQTPANIFQDTDRPSDWFVTMFGRIVLWHIKPRVVIYDEINPAAEPANTRLDTWLGFGHMNFNATFGGLVRTGSTIGGGSSSLNTLTPYKGWNNDNAALYKDVVITHDLSSLSYQHKIVSLHNPNFRLFTPNYSDVLRGNTILTRSSFTANNLTSMDPYLRMQDNQGEWWIRTFQDHKVDSTAIAFNCGTELPP